MAKERDHVNPDKLRRSLLDFADLIRKLDEEGGLVDSAPRLLKIMGDLRSVLFEYEVRSTGRLLPKSKEPPEVLEAQRIVEDAVRRLEEAEQDWGGGNTGGQPPQDNEEES